MGIYEVLFIFIMTLGLLVWFMSRRPRREPSKLKMRAYRSTLSRREDEEGSHASPPSYSQSTTRASATQGTVPLNVNFDFDGYTYDAYQVLGLPGGSSWSLVKKAYQTERVALEKEYSSECVQMAFEALRRVLS